MQIDPRQIACLTLAQITGGESWRLGLLHDLPTHMLVWITRGQGRAILHGLRRGIGVHNAMFLPAGNLFSLDPGPQGFGQVLLLPPNLNVPLPDTPQHLRIRDVQSQAECTALLDALQREARMERPYLEDALTGHVALLSVWLRRQMASDTYLQHRKSAAEALTERYATLIVQDFRSGQTVADFAGRLGVTPTHLTRACRAACGKTAAQMLTERVVWEARKMLTHDRAPIRDIARSLGFSSAGYFTRFMQQHTGKAPSALRRRVLGNA